MRTKLITDVSATLARTLFPVKDFVSPFTVGREVVLVVTKTGDFAGGDVTIETDAATDGSFSDVRPAADADGATTRLVEYFNVTLGDNIAVTADAITAGGFEVRIMGDC